MDLKFDDLANGAVMEKINTELQKVFENINDPNTSDTTKRKLTVSMVFTPDKHDKEVVTVDIDVKPTLAAVMGVSTRFIVGVDAHGKIEAAEWGKEMKGQVILTETEKIEEVKEISAVSKVIDYQKKVN